MSIIHRIPMGSAHISACPAIFSSLDECCIDDERQACREAASRALEPDIRPVGRPKVTWVNVLSADPVKYQTGFGISVVGGPGFLVTEVSCGCRRRYFLDLHSLITKAVAARPDTGGRDCHDLREPLQAMTGYSEVLLEDYGSSLGAEGRSHAEKIRAASQTPDTGTGLASVRQIVERHGGHVRATGATGEGATFSFTLAATNPAP